MNKDGLMTTAEFANLCHVKKRALFLYDEIGLLKPERVLENNYRLYGMNQYRKMDMLKALQSTGMTLEEIKSFMNSNDQKEIHYHAYMYRTQTQQLKEKIASIKITLSVPGRSKALWMQCMGTCLIPAKILALSYRFPY